MEVHKKELSLEQDTVWRHDLHTEQAHAKWMQPKCDVTSQRQKVSQDPGLSRRGEIWSMLMKERDEHAAALLEKDVRPFRVHNSLPCFFS